MFHVKINRYLNDKNFVVCYQMESKTINTLVRWFFIPFTSLTCIQRWSKVSQANKSFFPMIVQNLWNRSVHFSGIAVTEKKRHSRYGLSRGQTKASEKDKQYKVKLNNLPQKDGRPLCCVALCPVGQRSGGGVVTWVIFDRKDCKSNYYHKSLLIWRL